MIDQGIRSEGTIKLQVLEDTSQANNEFNIAAPGVEAYVLGRSDTGSQYHPDVDMAPFGAQEKGISRRHAVLLRHHDMLHILDLGSMNGTFLNGRRLTAKTAYPVNDGDTIGLGNLNLIIFQTR